jgi:hypothetical protein
MSSRKAPKRSSSAVDRRNNREVENERTQAELEESRARMHRTAAELQRALSAVRLDPSGAEFARARTLAAEQINCIRIVLDATDRRADFRMVQIQEREEDLEDDAWKVPVKKCAKTSRTEYCKNSTNRKDKN